MDILRPSEFIQISNTTKNQLESTNILQENCALGIFTTKGLPEISGTLRKWTNYIHGWQHRFVILKQGTLSYYKSEDDVEFGCRGAVSLSKAILTPHELDELRFDVVLNDSAWYLRASSALERTKWVEALGFYNCSTGTNHNCDVNTKLNNNENNQVSLTGNSSSARGDSGFGGSENSLLRQSSCISIISDASLSTTRSGPYFKKGSQLQETITELEAFGEMLLDQINVFQAFFDSTTHSSPRSNWSKIPSTNSITFPNLSLMALPSNYMLTANTCQKSATLPAMTDLAADRLVDNRRHKRARSLPLPSCGRLHRNLSHLPSPSFLDLKSNASTFKATTAGLLQTLSHCIDLFYAREDHWCKKLGKEIEKRKKFEELYKLAQSRSLKNPLINCGGPDFEEGPHCVIKEEEFFDAVETTLDKLDKEDAVFNQRQQLANLSKKQYNKAIALPKLSSLSSPSKDELITHRLMDEINRVFAEQLANAQIDLFVSDDNSSNFITTNESGSIGNFSSVQTKLDQHVNESEPSPWQLIAQEGVMKIYKRELEEEGLVCDPLKAIHIVEGVTAREVCHYFFDPNYRHDWETTLETMKVLEIVAPDTLIFHQIHKRVWPATQRDSCFWSHIRKVENQISAPLKHAGSKNFKEFFFDTWAVCNYSNDHVQAKDPNCIRVKLAVFLHCQTIIDDAEDIMSGYGRNISEKLSRDQIKCKITYCSKINPGGWTPPTVLRAVYKREYPKFLKKFTGYVKDQTKNKKILL